MRITQHLAEFVVRLADLAEAEGRVLRRVAARLGLGVSLALVAAVLVLLGCVLLLAAAWLGVGSQLGPIWASAVTGLAALGLGAGVFYMSAKISKGE